MGAESLRQEGVAQQLKEPSHCFKVLGKLVSLQTGHFICSHPKPTHTSRPSSDATASSPLNPQLKMPQDPGATVTLSRSLLFSLLLIFSFLPLT